VTTLHSVGHGAGSIEELLAVLEQAGIERLVDVRTAPGSRKHPQFGRDALSASLEVAGITYEWRKDLGGFRKPQPGSPHVALESPAFQGYADHMDTEEFGRAIGWLIETPKANDTAFMCAESLWWRCHRRMIADALTARGCIVIHLMAGGRREPHRLHPAARIRDGRLVYDVEGPVQEPLPT
jgi:uncharacterized protein (DUF488 family)